MAIRFSILITTHNRIKELQFTLEQLRPLLNRNDVECIVCDDGSSDGTDEYLRTFSPNIQLIRNPKSIGLIGSRNKLMALAKGQYAISLDDDAHFLSENPLEEIEKMFKNTPDCGVLAFRIYWGIEPPKSAEHEDSITQVKGFVGCGHAWNMDAWRSIPDYPEWFIFYGEEDFAAYQLFLQNWKIIYAPQLFVHHRVDVRARKQQKDYRFRLRRSLRSGWYLMILFFPLRSIPKIFLYSLFMQIKKRVLVLDTKGSLALIQALGDLVINLPRLFKESRRFNRVTFDSLQKLPSSKIYWTPAKS
jgi:glycosyltransferase involved in cell wall biosynthesis